MLDPVGCRYDKADRPARSGFAETVFLSQRPKEIASIRDRLKAMAPGNRSEVTRRQFGKRSEFPLERSIGWCKTEHPKAGNELGHYSSRSISHQAKVCGTFSSAHTWNARL